MYLAETRRWLQLPLRRQSLFALTFSFQAEHQDLLIPVRYLAESNNMR